jgi:hypothetical protein
MEKLCVVPMDTILKTRSPDMVTLFFNAAFRDSRITRAMQGVVALAIMGNSKYSVLFESDGEY